MEFKSSMSLSTFKKSLPSTHIEERRGTQD